MPGSAKMNNQYRPDFPCVIPGECRAGQNGQPEHNAPHNNLAEPRYNSGEQSRPRNMSSVMCYFRASAFRFDANRFSNHALPRLQPACKASVIHSCNHVFNIARSARLSTLKHKTLTP